KLNYIWVLPLFPVLFLWFIISEFLLNTIYQVSRIFIEYVKTVAEDFSLMALIIALIVGPITIVLSIAMKLILVIIISISNIIKRTKLLLSLDFEYNTRDIFLWIVPTYTSFPN